MFNKIRKRGNRKSKSDAILPPIPTTSPPPNVTVNHSSLTAAVASPHMLTLANVPNSGVVECLPLLKEVSLAERHVLFIKKLQICCRCFDSMDDIKSAREREIKRQTLIELVDLVQSGSCKLNEIMQDELIKMISVNLFRCLPPTSHENSAAENVDPDEDEMFTDPSYPHLQIVYELLLKYVLSPDMDTKISKRYLDHSFVSKLLNLFDSEDPREREYLKAILHRIYGKFMVHRPFIRKAINDVFYRFIFETERHSGIAELLEILGSIINGFALPMKEEHKLFLVRALIPLHKPKNAVTYHQQLSYCITQFVEKDYRLADTVIRGLLKYWPVTNCGKEVYFLGELEEVLEGTQSEEFERIMVPLFRQIGRSINSPNFQVAERALFFWNNEHIVSLISEHRHIILPILFEPLEKNVSSHWNQAVHGLSGNIQKMFLEMDVDLFEECQEQYEEKELRAREVEVRRELTWKRLEAAAAEQGKGDTTTMIRVS